MAMADLKHLRSVELNAGIDEIKPDFVLHLPGSALSEIIAHCEALPDTRAFPVSREEEAVGIAAGLALTGRRVLTVIQDNGLGNALTALTTFPLAYHIPLLLLVSRRGGLNEYNSMIHTFSERVEAIATASGLSHFSLDGRMPLEFWRPTTVSAYAFARTTHRPVVLFCNLMGG